MIQKNPTQNNNGLFGELMVTRELKTLPSSTYFTMNNITLECCGTTTQIDHVVFSKHGVFVIETKAYNGLITVGEKTWVQHLGKNKYKFTNPYLQNRVHIKVLAQLLGIPKTKFHNIVVFTHSDVKFNKECTTQLKDLTKEMLAYTDCIIDIASIPRHMELIIDNLCHLSTHISRIQESKNS